MNDRAKSNSTAFAVQVDTNLQLNLVYICTVDNESVAIKAGYS